jgi:hypothetical protein
VEGSAHCWTVVQQEHRVCTGVLVARAGLGPERLSEHDSLRGGLIDQIAHQVGHLGQGAHEEVMAVRLADEGGQFQK